jgi:hypothetical protein
MDAPQYAHVDVPSEYPGNDVPSEYPVAWMFYYTHHSNVDAPQYAHVDVPSDFFFY